jgi:uncharacterized protein (TIGR04255 family)
MGETLKDPPLVEVICELRFAAESAWDDGVPGRLADALPDYPKRETPESTVEISLRLRSVDEAGLVQVGPRVLVVNQLRPYERWAKFRERVERAVGAYLQANPGARPREVVLSATNIFPEVDGRIDLSQSLRRVPPLYDRMAGGRSLGFTLRQDFALDEPKGGLICIAGVGVADGIGAGLLLRLEFVSGAWTSWDELLPLLDKAHDKIYEAFVELLNPAEYARRKEGR